MRSSKEKRAAAAAAVAGTALAAGSKKKKKKGKKKGGKGSKDSGSTGSSDDGNSSLGGAALGDSDDDASIVVAGTAARSSAAVHKAMSFVRPAPRKAGSNRYGGVEIHESDQSGDDAESLLGGGGGGGGGRGRGGDGGGGGSDDDGEGFGVFFDDKSAIEVMLEMWQESVERSIPISPQRDALALARRPVTIADSQSAAAKRVSDITADSLARRIELSVFNLMSGMHYAMCVKEWDPALVTDSGVAESIKQAPHISRYQLPWHQTASDGAHDLSEAVDAIVFETVEKVRNTVLARLKRGQYAIVSNLEVISISHPTKRILIVNCRA
jgi:hypothetical protein